MVQSSLRALPRLQLHSDTPLYQQLKRWFVEQIKRGKWSEKPLPSERHLSEALVISRSTVRQALAALEREGWVEKKRGRGTFVLRPKVEQSLSRLTGFTENMLQAGLRPSSRVLAQELRQPDDRLRQVLALSPGSKVAVISRLRCVESTVLMLERSYLNDRLTPGLIDRDLSGSLYQLLTQVYHLSLAKGEESLEVIKADKSLAKLLGVAPAEPLLYTERLVRTAEGTPLEFAERYARADKCKFRLALVGNKADFTIKEL